MTSRTTGYATTDALPLSGPAGLDLGGATTGETALSILSGGSG